MVCRVDFFDRVILARHNPNVESSAVRSSIEQPTRKADGHYDRDDLVRLVEDGRAVCHDEKAIDDVVRGLSTLLGGCLPVDGLGGQQ